MRDEPVVLEEEVMAVAASEERVDGAVEMSVESEASATLEPKRRSKDKSYWAGWVMAMVLVGAVLGGVTVAFLRFVDGPAEGVVAANSLPALRASMSPTPKAPSRLSGLNFDMDYPNAFDMVGQVRNDPQALEQYNIGSKKDYSNTIAVSVRRLASSNLEDDSSYKFRLTKRDEYKMEPDTIVGEPVMVAVKSDRLEQTLFWVHQGKEITVSMTINNPNKYDLSDYMKVVKKGLRWRQ